MHHGERWRERQLHHRRKIAHEVVAQIAIEANVACMRAARLKQRIAIGGRLGPRLGTDIARGAGTVIDDHLLTEDRAHAAGNDARQSVGPATW